MINPTKLVSALVGIGWDPRLDAYAALTAANGFVVVVAALALGAFRTGASRWMLAGLRLLLGSPACAARVTTRRTHVERAQLEQGETLPSIVFLLTSMARVAAGSWLVRPAGRPPLQLVLALGDMFDAGGNLKTRDRAPCGPSAALTSAASPRPPAWRPSLRPSHNYCCWLLVLELVVWQRAAALRLSNNQFKQYLCKSSSLQIIIRWSYCNLVISRITYPMPSVVHWQLAVDHRPRKPPPPPYIHRQ